MKARRVTELGVHNLELVFAPIGLPLIEKTSPETPTTSVLVRGGAGAGKTTLAMALAQSIARETGGFALYLTTELNPMELSFKATLLGLDESIVMPWQERGRAELGTIAVEPLALVTSEGQKRSARDAVWEILEARDVETSTPVRLVVLDAPTLPAPGQNEALRADFVSFLQALEDRGISTISIEDSIEEESARAWLPFVVDVVFELGFAEEKETGALRRKLVCRKSRYSRALPGPHDYGLGPEQEPSVWPDLLAVVSANESLPFAVPEEQRARILVPVDEPDLHTILQGGNIVVDTYDESGGDFLRVLHATPGISNLIVGGASLSRVHTPQGTTELLDDDGPNALGCFVARTLASEEANTVIFNDLEALLTQPRYRDRFFHVIEALRHLGYLVCLHGSSEGLAPFVPRANLVIGKTYRSYFKLLTFSYLSSSKWLIELGSFDSSIWSLPTRSAASPRRLADAHAARSSLSRVESEIVQGHLEAVLKEIRSTRSQLSSTQQRWPLPGLALALAEHRLGMPSSPQQLLSLYRPGVSKDDSFLALAWTFALMGHEVEAIRYCFDAYASMTEPLASHRLLWTALNAVHAESDAAIDALYEEGGTKEEPFLFGFLLRALARRGRFDELDQAAASYQERHQIPDYLVPRLQADARLESVDPAVLADARARLAVLATDERLPLVHRAEVLHNLGHAHEELQDIDEARRCYLEAGLLNPYLQVAKDALDRFGNLEEPEEPEEYSASEEEL